MRKAMKKLGMSFPFAVVGAVAASLLVRGALGDVRTFNSCQGGVCRNKKCE
ncbi:hypothetical protein AA14337_2993 [Acetobacter malorum DSM 14337]|uniref:Uncharacterized protein n=1 Tax=Acetobacter malorum DSM 14337 TaxID=1307910 RepID=A0ABQ0PYZ9_9PROT|nr:hypothetical protein AA14337_2993 [Acetobacter malorum DSM 14337]